MPAAGSAAAAATQLLPLMPCVRCAAAASSIAPRTWQACANRYNNGILDKAQRANTTQGCCTRMCTRVFSSWCHGSQLPASTVHLH
jgi:hypothetical protein